MADTLQCRKKNVCVHVEDEQIEEYNLLQKQELKSTVHFITVLKSLLLKPPLAYGIVQYEQKALHPSCIFTKALV